MIEHYHVDFDESFFEMKQRCFSQHRFNAVESKIIETEISKLLSMGVIKEVQIESDQFLSPIFVRPKKNGEYRMILNLKRLNEFIPYHHFKMDTFEKTIHLITKDMYMASLDLRHAYYSIGLAEEIQRYFRFLWDGKVYQYTSCPNGLACLPRLFTKMMKPIYSKLRSQGFTNSGFIDDSLLCGETKEKCVENVDTTKTLMIRLGLMIHEEKSVFEPTKQIVFLGNIIDSEKMTVYLPIEKVERVIKECRTLYNLERSSIRTVAKVIGILVSTFSAVEYGRLYYRELEREKFLALRRNQGNYDADMRITQNMKQELKWWFTNVAKQDRKITHGNPEIQIQTDASLSGWGAICQDSQTGGRWSDEEKENHINFLELKAIQFALKAFQSKIEGKHVKILTDNTTALSYVLCFGGMKSKVCNSLSKEIWFWCIDHSVWLSCSHIAGKNNPADTPSRQFNDQLEWSLSQEVFSSICEQFGTPKIDLFASRLNRKLPIYCSFQHDPFSSYVDAFTIDWGSVSYAYLFPPFSLLTRCTQKIVMDKARCLVVAPLWPTQIWFTALMKILIRKPVVLPRTTKILTLPHMNTPVVHPLSKKLVLIACLVSGIASESEDFRNQQPILSCHPGELELKSNTRRIYQDGYSTVIEKKLIHFQLL